jgi:hypothetical protein
MTRARLRLASSALFLAEGVRAADPPRKVEPERVKLWNQLVCCQGVIFDALAGPNAVPLLSTP